MSFIYDFEPYLIKRSKNKLDETYCHIDDLNARFDCLQNNLIDVLRSLSMEESLKLSEGIRLERHGATNTSETERSFGSGLWSSITAFFQRRVLSISVSRFVEGLMPTSVTKARIFEYDESLEQLFDAFFFDSETDTSESRGKKKKRKKFKKAIMIAIMTKAAIAAKAVLAGVVLLAKKALMVSIISLMMSLITAKKKKGKGDDHRRTDYYDDYIEWD
ncbi:hypothetical protein C0J52_16937 [Blattella germanica]|nr:hypothetical protein C0J52_16937 [Blattella germanica]